MSAILFTSAGRRVELVRAFRHAASALRPHLAAGIRIICTDIDPLAPALQVADKAYLVPRYSAPDYVPALAHICAQEGVLAIFPLIDPDIPILAAQRALLEATGAEVGVLATDAVATTRDKWLTTLFFASLGLQTPQSWLPETLPSLDSLHAALPLFLKPRSGSAAQHAVAVHDVEALNFYLPRTPNPIVQELVQGDEITTDVVCDLNGALLAVVSRRRIEVRSGEVAKGVTVREPSVEAACIQIAGALHTNGPITVQCILRDGVPYFTEINARFGGGLPLSLAAGADVPRWLLARLLKVEETIPPVGNHQTGIYMTRYDQSFFLNETERARVGGAPA